MDIKKPNKHTLNPFSRLRVCSHVPALCTLVMSVGTRDLFSAGTFHSFMGQAGLSHPAKATFAHFGGLDEAVLSIFSWSFQGGGTGQGWNFVFSSCSSRSWKRMGTHGSQRLSGALRELINGSFTPRPNVPARTAELCAAAVQGGLWGVHTAGWGHPRLPPCPRRCFHFLPRC